ncbi:1-deoxy-D-xylulose-5-phosphate synthase, partial [Candidatus Woesearchaeota archaeon]|nr:1-deoxy-D-xylulose-5-phosphate synthase [Candidatus Woesearchaeota archaeon]
MGILSKVKSPADVKVLSKQELHQLAKEMRHEIIHTVAEKGGHLGPNLGVVELTLALHYVFDSPKDKIIWDVGHQSYPHKLITGRVKKFRTLRSYKGVSGYPNRKESSHDPFGTSHASTSISAGLGHVAARDLKNEQYNVIAVIGDGALTGGLSFEGLNQLGHLQKDMIVILNDNAMAISSNVGGLSKYLSNIVTNPNYADMRNKIKDAIMRFGEKTVETVADFENTLRSLSKEGMFFKALGLKYFGPIDGHNMEALIKALRNIQKIGGPILLHVVTKKGKGYPKAEEDREKWHGVSPFHIKNGEGKTKKTVVSYTDAFAEAMVTLGKEDKRIVGITAAMPKGTGLQKFGDMFPERYFDVGIAEQHAVTFAAGMACEGMKPVCAIYSTFLQRAYDQLIHDVCAQNLDVTFALDRAGIVGEDGRLQHGVFDYSYLSSIPNMVVMAPKDEGELGHMLKTAIYHEGPAALRYPRGSGIGVTVMNPYKRFKIGKSEILKRGKDVTLLSIGTCAKVAQEAAALLRKKDISAEVINARFVKPFDEKNILKSVKKTGNLVTIEEGVARGGFGSQVAAMLNERQIDAKVKCMGVPDKFIDHGPAGMLREKLGFDA